MSVRKFSGFDSSAASEVTALKSQTSVKKEPKFFVPGLHTVKIVSVEEKGPVSTDSSWERLWIKLEGTGGKSTYMGLSLPTESLLFKGEANSYPAQQFLAFVQALGYEATPKTLGGVLTKLFSDTSALEGLELQVQVGYNKSHLVMKDSKFHVMQKYGNKPVLKDGEAAIFSEREEAIEWGKSVKLEIQRFPEVVACVAAETLKAPVVAKKASDTRAAF